MPQTVSKQEVSGTASGVLLMAFFSFLWAGIGLGGLTQFIWLVMIISSLISLILLILGFQLLQKAKKFSKDQSDAAHLQGKKIGITFGIVFGLEGFFIGLASVIFSVSEQFEYFFPVMAIIVGLHFLPLAKLFQVKVHYVTGLFMTSLGFIALLFLPPTLSTGSGECDLWMIVVGFGSAIMLWVTGFFIWHTGNQLS